MSFTLNLQTRTNKNLKTEFNKKTITNWKVSWNTGWGQNQEKPVSQISLKFMYHNFTIILYACRQVLNVRSSHDKGISGWMDIVTGLTCTEHGPQFCFVFYTSAKWWRNNTCELIHTIFFFHTNRNTLTLSVLKLQLMIFSSLVLLFN